MTLLNFLRFRKRVPEKGPPPKNFVDVAYDADSGKIKAIDSDNNPVLFDGAGAGSTADLTTSNGSADAAAGKLGEYLENGPVAPEGLVSDTPSNVASITLTPGDWDMSGHVAFAFTTATGSVRSGYISTTSDASPADGIGYIQGGAFSALTASESAAIPTRRIRVSSSTPVYLVAEVLFGSGSVTGAGRISARRVR